MQTRHPLIHGILYAGLLVCVTGKVQALALHSLKDQHLEAIYGTYATGGDCQREPQIAVDESGFTFRYRGRDTRASTFIFAASFYTGAHGEPSEEDANKYAFFPFPSGVTEGKWGPETNDFGPVTMELDSKQRTLTMDAARDALLTPLQTALVQGSPYARCGMQAEAAALKKREADEAAASRARVERLSYPMHMNFTYNVIGPTPEMTAAVLRAAGADLRSCPYADRRCFAITLADLDFDGRAELLVRYTEATGHCDASGCGGIIVKAVPRGYAQQRLDNLQKFHNVVDVLAGKHQGMHDLGYDGHGPAWIWNGREYAVGQAGPANHGTSAPVAKTGATGPGWQTREAAGRTLAMAVATDSVIKSMSLFCDKGRPVLAALVKARPPAGPILLTFEFGGHAVNVPMGLGNHEGTLLLSDLSISDLPKWLARSGGEVQLRINGGMQGQVTLANSTAATQAALSSCYHY